MPNRAVSSFLLLAALISGCSRAPGIRAAAPRPLPEVDRVLIISIDGLRPDLALRARTPRLHALLQTGSYTFWARTTEMSITLPSHTSMLTGVPPKVHGVTWNTDQLPPQKYPKLPTLLETAKQSGYTTGMVAGKTKFSALAKPGTLNWVSIKLSGDAAVARLAVEMIHAHRPQVMFVHFPEVDQVGHTLGWASEAQIAAIERADARVGDVVDAIDEEGLTDSTLIIISADHGGAGITHGPEDARSRHIPWIASNPHIRQGYDLTRNARVIVNTEDTFATACLFLGLPTDERVVGKPVADIIPNRQLLYAKP